LNLDLTDEQRLIRETARDFTDREIIPRARDNDRAERFDLELVGKLAEMGYLGAPVAEQYGGRSWSPARSSSGAPRSRSASCCRSCARASGSGASG
jgi:alkylation response protein AidB-like acyl-CoA dehydrogenase